MQIFFNKNTPLDILVNDNSYRYRAIKGEHSLTLYFSLPQHIEIPIGAYCIFEGETYTLESPENLKMHNSRNFEYTVIFESSQAKAKKYKLRNPVDRRLKFNLTATPREHLQMFVDNMNMRDSGWTIGQCIDAPEKLISYNHAFCMDALSQQATEFETEYEFNGKQVSLWKVEYNKDNPLPLSYGRGNGFKPGVGRTNFNDSKPVEVLFVQGGEQNIDASKYKSRELLLPKNQILRYDGKFFEGQAGFNASVARTYISDADGFSIKRQDKPLRSQEEDSLDLSHVYPSRVGGVTFVVVVDKSKNFYDIIDNTIPADLDFVKCLIEGETMSIIFQSGMLAGKEFEVKYYHEFKSIGGVTKAARRFEIVPQDIDGQTMPNDVFSPKTGDKYAVFGISLPDAYVCNNSTKSGASWDMFREAAKYLYENEEQKFTFTGELDGIWAKKDWLNIGGRIKLGGYVLFSDPQFQPDGVGIRIIGIKDYINNPHSPEIELSNSVVGSSIMSDIQKIESNEVLADSQYKEALQFTKRRFRDAKETALMLENSLLNFSGSISPVSISAMQMIVGDKSLQFMFVSEVNSSQQVTHNIKYNATTKILTAEAGILKHMTIGIASLSSSHKPEEYKYWNMAAFRTTVLTDPKAYYLYAKVSKSNNTGVFYMSTTAIEMDALSGCYHFLVGVLNSEFDNERSWAQLYGFSELTPGQMLVDRVVSPDGLNYLDFIRNAFRVGNNDSYLDWNNLEKDTLNTVKMKLKDAYIQNKLSVLGEALIAGFLFSDKIIKSETKTGDKPAMYLDGKYGKVHLESTKTGGDYSLDNSSSSIDLDAISGDIIARNNNGVSYLSASGVFCNNANTNAAPGFKDCTHYGAIVAVPFGTLDYTWYFDQEKTLMAGVYGKASNLGTAPAYGGYFVNLMAAGLIFNTKYVTDGDNPLILDDSYTQIIGLANSKVTSTVYLPAGNMEGKVIFAKQMGQGKMRFRQRSGQFILDDIYESDYYDILMNWEVKFTFSSFMLNGVKKEVWLVSKFVPNKIQQII